MVVCKIYLKMQSDTFSKETIELLTGGWNDIKMVRVLEMRLF